MEERAKKRTLKLVAVAAVLVLSVAGIAYLLMNGFGGSSSSGSLAPDFALRDSDGNAFSLSQFRGTLVVLFFMTTSDWCEPCKYLTREHLVPLKDTFGNRIQIISIEMLSTERSDADLNAYKAFYGSDWIYARDMTSGDVARAYRVTALSVVVIVDLNGYIRLGPEPDPPYDRMASVLRSLGL